jgi:uncharacterized protein (TIRG00374 family)
MKRLLALLVSALIMTAIFRGIDRAAFGRHLQEADPGLALLALALFAPQIALSAYRWRRMTARMAPASMREAAALVLAASALNIFLPSKMGDLAKALFLKRQGKLGLSRGTNVVVFERYLDLCALALVTLLGIFCSRPWSQVSWAGLGVAALLLAPLAFFFRKEFDGLFKLRVPGAGRLAGKAANLVAEARAYLDELRQNKAELFFLFALSLCLWFLHLIQFHVVFAALGAGVSVFDVFRLVPLAILFGLLPVTVAGVGTRDAALLYLFHGLADPALVAGVGLFGSLRYLVPGVLGLPFLNAYILRDEDAVRS